MSNEVNKMITVELDSSDLLSIRFVLKRQIKRDIRFDKSHPEKDSRNWLEVRKIRANLYSRIFHAHKNYWNNFNRNDEK